MGVCLFSDFLFEFRFSFEKLLFDRFSKYLFRLMNLLPQSGPSLPHLTVLFVGFPSLWHLSGAGSTFVVALSVSLSLRRNLVQISPRPEYTVLRGEKRSRLISLAYVYFPIFFSSFASHSRSYCSIDSRNIFFA
jgi:hypothetical protein